MKIRKVRKAELDSAENRWRPGEKRGTRRALLACRLVREALEQEGVDLTTLAGVTGHADDYLTEGRPGPRAKSLLGSTSHSRLSAEFRPPAPSAD
jgi:hypothetical protein